MLSARVATNMLTVAEGVAVDILLKQADGVNSLKGQPSSKAIEEAWGRLDSESLIVLAGSITDTCLLDKILAKEKRVTILRKIALNENLSEVSRLYLYQLGLIKSDSTLRSNALNGFEPLVIISMMENDDKTRYDLNQKVIYKNVIDGLDYDSAELLHKLWGADFLLAIIRKSVDFFVNYVSYKNVTLDESDIKTIGRAFSYDYPYGGMSKESILKLRNVIQSESLDNYIIKIFADDLTDLALIDKKLQHKVLSNLNGEITSSVADIIIEFSSKESLHSKKIYSVDEEVLDKLSRHFGAKECVNLFYRHENLEISSKNILLELDAFFNYDESLITKQEKVLYLLKVGRIAGYKFLHEYISQHYSDTKFENSFYRELRSHSDNYDKIFSDAPIEFYIKLNGIPSEVSKNIILNQIQNMTHESKFNEFISMVAIYLASDSNYLNDLVNIIPLIKNSLNEKDLVNIIENCHYLDQIRDEIEAIFIARPNLFNKILAECNSRTRREIIANHIALFRPQGSWSQYTRDEYYVSSIYKELSRHLGESREYWETALTLFDDWTGSLEDLANTAKTI